MKSPMITEANYIKDKENYSDMQVMKANAYYIGTVYTDPEVGFAEPGSRDSEYFRTEEEAAAYLAYIERTGDVSGLRRQP